ncbi:MAG: YybS family protein [Ilumatobacteraceae bacterium]|nr:YybS family protein [Ilumatobacteraceae bacterium]
MTDVATPAPQRGWWRLVLAVGVFGIAIGLPVAQTLLPLHQPLTAMVAMLAACAVVGWWRGGSLSLAIASMSVAVWLVWQSVRGGVSNDVLTAAWSTVAASCFGIALVASRSKWFLGKAVVAVLAALLVSAVLVVATPSGPRVFGQTLTSVLAVRGTADLNNWRVARSQMTKASTARADTATTAVLDRFEQQISGLPQLARVVLPSMLALQTLAAMAIGWALFHAVSRTRLGERLSRLREFRFNDHWIWSVIVGLVVSLLPALQALRPLGINLLVFFGAIYALRGAAVFAWFLRPGRTWLGLLVGVALLLLLRDGAAIALGFVGLGDTWADWRRRTRPAVS